MFKSFAAFNVLSYFSSVYFYLFLVRETTIRPLYWYLFSIGIGFIILVTGGAKLTEFSIRIYYRLGLGDDTGLSNMLFIFNTRRGRTADMDNLE